MERDYDWTAAQRELDAASQLAGPDARALRTGARLAGALGQFNKSLELLTQALARDPLDPTLYDQLGDTYARSGKFDKSENFKKFSFVDGWRSRKSAFLRSARAIDPRRLIPRITGPLSIPTLLLSVHLHSVSGWSAVVCA